MCRRVTSLAVACAAVVLLALAANSEPIPQKAPSGKPIAKAEAAPVDPPGGAKLATSRVTAVTVYPNSALVTREVEVPTGKGTLEVVVTPLPPQTVNSSLYTEGSDDIRVLATRFRTRQLMEDTREDVRKLEDELKQLQMAKEKLESDMTAVRANMLMVTKMENYTAVTTAASAEKAALNSDSAIALAKYVMDTRREHSKELVGLQQQVQANQEKTEFARRQLGELTSGSRRTEQDAVIVVDKTDAAAGKVRLHYLVNAASWLPQYKIRAGMTAKEPLHVEYLAAVIQHTGEDWSRVNLVLSTAQPTLNAAPPDLHALNVTVLARGSGAPTVPTSMDLGERSRNLRTQAQKDFNAKKQSSGEGLVNTAAALDQSWELLNPEAAVKRGCALAVREGPSVMYHLARALTVPSRNDEQIIEVARLEMKPAYYYKAVPVLTTHVYRLADLTNNSQLVLLPGEATMYIGTDFVGQMNLPLVAVGEQFTVGFGVDPQLQVQRQMIDKSRSTQGGNQVLRYEYRILASSYKSEKVKLQVWDRLPHAESDTVGVSLTKTSPEVSKDALYQREQRSLNLLRWDVTIEPDMNGEKALAINYDFKLDLDRNMSLGSFQTADAASGAPAPTTPVTMAAPNAPMPNPQDNKIRAQLAKLSPEDRKLAEAQVFCAIDQESPLGSMGPIYKVMCKGQPVFLCCKGCEAEAKTNPDQALTMLDKLRTRMSQRKQ